jgi:tetratricopeptide (TPR) repeat protein
MPASAQVDSIAAPAGGALPLASPPPAPGARPVEAPLPLPAYQRGDFIGDRLQVIETLGEGGFGIVYLARALASNEIVALKTLRGELLRDAKTRAMFEKEARIWIDLGVHPNLVRALWVSEIGGQLYIAMEYVRAGAGRPNSLEGHLAKGRIETGQALVWAIQFCRGMEYAMEKGVRCHRDIKPANILIGGDGVVKISDFGIAGLALVPDGPADAAATASVAGADDPAKTVPGTVFGTPTHMPPEQFVDAASCDERSDIYSFGVVLYQMASGGRLPFRPPPPPPALAAQAGAYYWHAFRSLHANAMAAPLSSPLSAIVSRCLEKAPADRYPSFAALRAELEVLYQGTHGAIAPVAAASGESAADWNAKGISLAALARWAEALVCYDQALAIDAQIAALHNNRGNALRNMGRAQESLAAYDQAIALDPLYAAPWENKALLYAGGQRNQEALECVDRALTLDPTAGGTWVTKGVLLGRLGRRDEQLDAYDAALRIDPRNGLAWFNKANTVSATDCRRALECLNQSLSCNPAYAPAWDLKGTLLLELGLLDQAWSCHHEAIRLDPQDWQAHYNGGNALVALEQFDQALKAYAEAARLNPGFKTCWYNLALTSLRVGEQKTALELFTHYLSLDPQEEQFRRTAERLAAELRAGGTPNLGSLGRGKRIAAEQTATIDVGVLPGVTVPAVSVGSAPVEPSATPAGSAPVETEVLPPPRPSLAQLTLEAAQHFNAGRFAEALAIVEQVLRIAPREPKALNTRANALFKLQRRDEACAAIDIAVESAPGDLTFWVNKAFIEKGAGRLADAARSALDLVEIAQVTGAEADAVEHAHRLIKECQARAIAPATRTYLGWLGLGFTSMLASRPDAALGLLDQAVAAAPGNIEVLRWKGSALKELGRADEALAVCDQALALAPLAVEVHHDRGVVLAQLLEVGQAVDAFDRALELDPNHVASLSDKGKYAAQLGRHEEALRALRRAVALVPEHPAPWLNKALIEGMLKRDEDELASHERFLELATPAMRLQIEDSKRKVERLRARIGARTGSVARPPAARAAGLVLTPPPVPQVVATASHDDCLKRSETARNQRRFDQALDWADQAIAANPQRHLGWLAKADALLGLARFADAAAHAKKAADLEPGYPPSWARLAASYDALHAFEAALVAWDKAVELAGQNLMHWTGRGVCLARLGRIEEALAAHEQSLVIDPRYSLGKYYKGLREADLGRRDAAILSLQQFLALAPANLAGLAQTARQRIQELKA